MVNKILGYVLIAVGLVIIGATLWQSYNIFTAKISAPLVFKTQSIENQSSKNNSLDLQKQMEGLIQQQIGQMIPADTLPKTLNLLSWSILTGILIFGGGTIAGIGAKMVK